MRTTGRLLGKQLEEAMAAFPGVVLTGPRRAGKTYLLRQQFPKAAYVLMEDPEMVARLRSDPRAFVEGLTQRTTILDEIQNVPEIFPWIRAAIDRAPHQRGRFILTGSQEAPLMQGVTESMAGRAAILTLLPMSNLEHAKVGMLHGGYPEVLARPKAATLWFDSYLQTYLERDVRAVLAIKDLATFRRFLALVASRHGQILNRTDLAAPLGISVPTVQSWLNVLEATAQIFLVPPYFENLGKRLIKSPKLYVADAGMACHLLGLQTLAELKRSPFYGAVFEGFVLSEIVKSQVNRGARREVYYFRDQQGLEVDFIRPHKTARGAGLQLIEVKAARTVFPHDAANVVRLRSAWRGKHPGRHLEAAVIYQPGNEASDAGTVLAPGIQALTWKQLIAGG